VPHASTDAPKWSGREAIITQTTSDLTCDFLSNGQKFLWAEGPVVREAQRARDSESYEICLYVTGISYIPNMPTSYVEQ